MQDAGHAVATIVVGLDGSADDHEAMRWAAGLVRSLDAGRWS